MPEPDNDERNQERRLSRVESDLHNIASKVDGVSESMDRIADQITELAQGFNKRFESLTHDFTKQLLQGRTINYAPIGILVTFVLFAFGIWVTKTDTHTRDIAEGGDRTLSARVDGMQALQAKMSAVLERIPEIERLTRWNQGKDDAEINNLKEQVARLQLLVEQENKNE